MGRKQPSRAAKHVYKPLKSVEDHLESLGLRVKDMLGDGNCLFRSLADQFDGEPDSYDQHRQEVCDYIKEHPDDFVPFITEESAGSLDKYLKNMRSDGTYGGNMELVAFSRLHKCSICVYQDDGIIFCIDPEETAERTIHLAYHSYEHYSSVRRKDSPLEGVFEMPKPTLVEASTSLDIPAWAEKHVSQSTGIDDMNVIRRQLRASKGNVDDAVEALLAEDQLDTEETMAKETETTQEHEVKKNKKHLSTADKKRLKKRERKQKKQKREDTNPQEEKIVDAYDSAKYDYKPGEPNEIGFKQGDVFNLIVKHNADWWEGEINGASGLFPANRVEEIADEPPIAHDKKPFINPPVITPRPSSVVIKKKESGGSLSVPSSTQEGQRLSSSNLSDGIESPLAKVPSSNSLVKPKIDVRPSSPNGDATSTQPPQMPPPRLRERTPSASQKPAIPGLAPLNGEMKQRRPDSIVDNNPIAEELNKRLSFAGGAIPPGLRQARGSNPPPMMAELHSKIGSSERASGGDVMEDDGDEEVPAGNLDAANAANIKKEGFLQKRNSDEKKMTLRAWRNLWVELADGNLYFYKDAQNKKKADKKDKPIAVADIKSSRVDFSGNLDKKKLVFSITNYKGDTLLLQAPTETELKSWEEAISEVPGIRRENVADLGAVISPGRKSSEPEPQPSEKKKPATLKKQQTDPKFKKSSTPSSAADDDLPEAERKAQAKKSLLGFFKSRPTVEALKERGIIKEETVFGGILENQIANEKRKVPLVVEHCIKVVEEKGLDCVGIYRLSGNASTIQKLRFIYNDNPSSVDLSQEEFADVNIITGLLKLYFRELQKPLLPSDKYDFFIAASKISDPDARANAIKEIVKKIPKANYDTLAYLIKHLVKVAKMSHINKMDPSNIGIVFGPTLMRPQVETFESIMNTGNHSCVVETIISNADSIFG